MNPTPNDPLDDLIRQSRRDVTLPPRFQSEVWQRIADRESESPWTALQSLLESATALLVQPRYAAALFLVTMLLGAGTAQLTTTRPDSATMQARYVSMIDPYAPRAR